MLEAICPKCGLIRYGWALQNPEHQECPKCRIKFEIRISEGKIFDNQPSLIEGYFIDPDEDIIDFEHEDE